MVSSNPDYESLRHLEYLLNSTRNLIDYWRQMITSRNPDEKNLGFDEIVERYYRQIGVPATDRQAVVAIVRAALSQLE
jgi:hypothetical protein